MTTPTANLLRGCLWGLGMWPLGVGVGAGTLPELTVFPKELYSLRIPGDKSLKSAGFSGGYRPWTFSGERGIRLRQHT